VSFVQDTVLPQGGPGGCYFHKGQGWARHGPDRKVRAGRRGSDGKEGEVGRAELTMRTRAEAVFEPGRLILGIGLGFLQAWEGFFLVNQSKN
jgi:hypothetical protein